MQSRRTEVVSEVEKREICKDLRYSCNCTTLNIYFFNIERWDVNDYFYWLEEFNHQ